jgi:nucleotide-binding universal stress UspA family protein
MPKDIILHLERDPSRDIARDFAASIAELFSAHLTAVISNFEANIPADALGDLFAESEAEARGAIERFELAMKRGELSAESRLVLGTPQTFSEVARCFDLSIVMQSDDHKGINNSILIETTLFDSGRPLIIVPSNQREVLKLEKIVCCWDGSRTAARAINDALPFLKKAKAVELLIVEDEKTANEQVLRGTEIGQHLARHDIKVNVKTIPAADRDVANAILSYVAGGSTSLLVMGGYGHSRLREFVFGGVTRGMLSAMTVPVFMSH